MIEEKKKNLTENEQTLSQLFLRFHPLLFHFGMKMVNDEYLVEETIQNIFLYFVEKNKDFNTVQNEKSYLFTAFRRQILEQKEKQKKRRLLRFDFHKKQTNIQFNNADFFLQKEKSFKSKPSISHSLNNLPWRQREAIYLRYFNNLSTKEIANIMEITPQVVSNTICKALKKLRKEYL